MPAVLSPRQRGFKLFFFLVDVPAPVPLFGCPMKTLLFWISAAAAAVAVNVALVKCGPALFRLLND